MAKLKLTRIEKILAIALIATVLFAIGTNLTTINNPTAAQVTFTQTWKQGVTMITDIKTATISGTVTCNVLSSATGVLESTTIIGLGQTMTIGVPYWIDSIYLEITGLTDPLYSKILQFSKPSGYDAAINTWYTAWVNSVIQKTDFTANPPAPATWAFSLNTATMPNGEYTFKLKATWIGPTVPNVSIPMSPPSLSGSSGAVTFSVFSASFNSTGGTTSAGTGGNNETPTTPAFDASMILLAGAGLGGLLFVYEVFLKKKR